MAIQKDTKLVLPIERSYRCATPGGDHILRHVEHRDYSERDKRLTTLLDECKAAIDDGVVPSHVATICFRFAQLLGFPKPTVYLDGDGSWCFDWEHEEDEKKGVFTCLASEDRLLVVADLGNRYLRVPCDLSEDDPLELLMTALNKVFRV